MKDFNFVKKLSVNGMKRRRLTMQQYVLQYVQVALGRESPSFFFFFAGPNLHMLNTIIECTYSSLQIIFVYRQVICQDKDKF